MCLAIYQNTLRLQGLIVLGFVILLLTGALQTDLPGLWHPIPVTTSLISALIALVFVWPQLTPRAIARPSGASGAASVIILHAIVPFIMMVPVMMSILTFDLGEPMSRYFAVSSAALVFLCSATLWFMGLVLSLWTQPPSRPDPAPFPRDGFDFRGAA